MKKWTFTVTMEVADVWVEDGFQPTEEMVVETLQETLCTGATYGIEFKVAAKMTKAPDLAGLVIEA